jgi:hypothetical protein
LGDDAAPGKELKINNVLVPENNSMAPVPPSLLLEAIAPNSQVFESAGANIAKIDASRQVAIIARLVIAKLHGADSSKLELFEEELRPPFSVAGIHQAASQAPATQSNLLARVKVHT